MKDSDSKRLNAREDLFCHHYIAVKFNGAEAARLAGYAEGSCNVKAAQLLAKVSIQDRIEELKYKVVEKARKGAEDVYNMAANAAFLDVREVLTIKGGKVFLVGDLDDLPKEVAILIQAIKEKTTQFGTTIEIVFVDKLKALEMLARFNGMNKDSLKIENPHEGKSVEELAAILKAKREAGIE